MIYDPTTHLWLPGRFAPTKRSQRGAVGIMAQRMPMKPANTPVQVFASDTFTAADGTTLANHTDTAGLVPNTWSQHPASSSTMSITGNEVLQDGNFGWYITGIAPTVADYEVVADFVVKSTGGSFYAGLLLRSDPVAATTYMLRYEPTTNFALYKWVSGTPTLLGVAATGYGVGTYRVRVLCQGTRIFIYIDNALKASFTDSSISAKGYAGIYGQAVMSSSTGTHIDNFFADYGITNDTMTAPDGTNLTAHTGERGAGWTSYGTGDAFINSDRVRQDNVGGNAYEAYASGVPTNANVVAEADLYVASQLSGSFVGITGRNLTGADTKYFLLFDRVGPGQFEFYSAVAGSFALLGTAVANPAVGSTTRLVMFLNGNALFAQADTLTVFNSTNSAVTGTGRIGMQMQDHATASTGYHMTNFWYTNWPGVAGNTPPVIS